MKPIDILGVKNFRLFDDKDGMFTEMADINLITGANNTGKSSITKLLQMVRNSMNGNLFPFDLDLTEQEHLLGDFNNLLNNKENKQVNISLPFTFLGLTKLYVSLTFEVAEDDSYKAKLRGIEVKDYSAKSDSTLFSFIYREATEIEKKAHDKQLQKDRQKYEEDKKKADRKYDEMIAKGEKYNAFLINNGFLIPPLENPLDSFVEWTINRKMLKNYLDQLIKIYTSYIKHNGNFDWLEKSDKLADEAAIPFIPSTFINSFKGPVNVETWQKFIDKELTEGVEKGKSKIGEYDFEIDDIFDARLGIEHLLYSKSLDILKEQLLWKEYESKNKEFKYNVIVNCFETSWKNLANRISSIHIISALREENSRGYNTTVNTPFTNLLKDFDSLKGRYIDFMKKYLKEFEIGKKIKVEHLLSYQLMKVFIETLDGQTRELVDFGSGIKQLILILMQISVLSKKNELRNHIYDYSDEEMIRINYRPSILVIEEPENYLHPKWQSKLAEMFLEAAKKYNIQLIIETHSEYLIRSFQNLVADKRLKTDKIKIFYLRDKQYTKKGKKQLQKMSIEKDGSMDYEAFDSGFFDVSDELKLSRLNIHAKQFITEFEQLKQLNDIDGKKITKLEKVIDNYVEREDMQFFEREVARTIDISSLNESTVKYISSGQLLIDKIPYDGDFSPVLIQYGRAMENEMKDLFLRVDSDKKWMLGNMQGSLEKAINSVTEIKSPCNIIQLRRLKDDILPSYFRNAKNLDVASIEDLRNKRNTAGHPGETKNKDEALNYIANVTEFLRNWIGEKI